MIDIAKYGEKNNFSGVSLVIISVMYVEYYTLKIFQLSNINTISEEKIPFQTSNTYVKI